MWHLKTKLGTFWIVQPEENQDKRCYLGMDDTTIRAYSDVQDAIEDVCNHTTGEINWDVDTRIKVPSDIHLWQEGEPEVWRKN
jgi:hypothetical protein